MSLYVWRVSSRTSLSLSRKWQGPGCYTSPALYDCSSRSLSCVQDYVIALLVIYFFALECKLVRFQGFSEKALISCSSLNALQWGSSTDLSMILQFSIYSLILHIFYLSRWLFLLSFSGTSFGYF